MKSLAVTESLISLALTVFFLKITLLLSLAVTESLISLAVTVFLLKKILLSLAFGVSALSIAMMVFLLSLASCNSICNKPSLLNLH